MSFLSSALGVLSLLRQRCTSLSSLHHDPLALRFRLKSAASAEGLTPYSSICTGRRRKVVVSRHGHENSFGAGGEPVRDVQLS